MVMGGCHRAMGGCHRSVLHEFVRWRGGHTICRYPAPGVLCKTCATWPMQPRPDKGLQTNKQSKQMTSWRAGVGDRRVAVHDQQQHRRPTQDSMRVRSARYRWHVASPMVREKDHTMMCGHNPALRCPPSTGTQRHEGKQACRELVSKTWQHAASWQPDMAAGTKLAVRHGSRQRAGSSTHGDSQQACGPACIGMGPPSKRKAGCEPHAASPWNTTPMYLGRNLRLPTL
jgi:hypothetical protein